MKIILIVQYLLMGIAGVIAFYLIERIFLLPFSIIFIAGLYFITKNYKFDSEN
ncbi:hypothetical protein ACWOBB_09785 [Lactococcus petauri]